LRKKFRTLDEKMRLSLERDRRPCYGESDKGPRKNIPLQKQLANRHRRIAKAGLSQIATGDNLEAETIEAAVCARDLAAHRSRWRKCPDMPLRNFIERQSGSRVAREGRRKRGPG
jgi:hypothetical protein